MRHCILEPIPEMELSAKLLDACVDALLIGDTRLASALVGASDIREIMAHAIRIIGPMSEEVHGNIKRPRVLPKAERDPRRMPSEKIQYTIFSRDGWRCRFCRVKVFSRKARRKLIETFPLETHWNRPDYERHTSLYSMAVSLDHVVPHGRGGMNSIDNFVTCCYCCQFGRGEWTLDEMNLIDPRETVPVVDGWDGLSRLDTYNIKKA